MCCNQEGFCFRPWDMTPKVHHDLMQQLEAQQRENSKTLWLDKSIEAKERLDRARNVAEWDMIKKQEERIARIIFKNNDDYRPGLLNDNLFAPSQEIIDVVNEARKEFEFCVRATDFQMHWTPTPPFSNK